MQTADVLLKALDRVVQLDEQDKNRDQFDVVGVQKGHVNHPPQGQRLVMDRAALAVALNTGLMFDHVFLPSTDGTPLPDQSISTSATTTTPKKTNSANEG